MKKILLSIFIALNISAYSQGIQLGNEYSYLKEQHFKDSISIGKAAIFADKSIQKTAYIPDSLTWIKPVKMFSAFTTCTTKGDRYVASASGSGWIKNRVYECDGFSWIEHVPIIGDAVYNKDDTTIYTWSGNQWNANLNKLPTQIITFGTAIDSSLCITKVKFAIGYVYSTFTVDTMIVILTATGGNSPNITPDIRFGTDISASGTSLISSPSAVTSKTTSTKIYTFNNANISGGSIIWLTFSAVSTKPRNILIQLKGH